MRSGQFTVRFARYSTQKKIELAWSEPAFLSLRKGDPTCRVVAPRAGLNHCDQRLPQVLIV